MRGRKGVAGLRGASMPAMGSFSFFSSLHAFLAPYRSRVSRRTTHPRPDRSRAIHSQPLVNVHVSRLVDQPSPLRRHFFLELLEDRVLLSGTPTAVPIAP